MSGSSLQDSNQVIAERYADDVLSGRVVAGKLVKQACERYHVDHKEKRFEFSKAHADRAINFFRCMKHTQGQYLGHYFDPLPFQVFILWNLYGWREGALRRYREAFLSMARGNGKTPLGCGIVLYSTSAERPDYGRLTSYLTATKAKQAKLSFDDVAAFLSSQPQLREGRCDDYWLTRSRHLIEFPNSNNSTIEALSADGSTTDGLRTWVWLRDELHAWTRFHRDFAEKMMTSLAKFPDSLTVTTTTAGDDMSELWAEQKQFADAATDVRSETRFDQIFAYLAEIDDEDDPLDESCWPKANPALEHGIVKIDVLRNLAKKARIDPKTWNMFKRYYANKLVPSMDRAFSHELWNMGNQIADTTGALLYMGVDLGFREDLAGLGMVWALPPDDNGKPRWAIDGIGYVPRRAAKWAQRPFSQWRSLVSTQSEYTDVHFILSDILSRAENGVAEIGIDKYGAQSFQSELERQGLPVEPVPQIHSSFDGPIRELSAALADGRVYHAGNEILEYCAHNAVTKMNPQGKVMLDKKASSEKIDVLVAVLIALNRAMGGAKPFESCYESETACI